MARQSRADKIKDPELKQQVKKLLLKNDINATLAAATATLSVGPQIIARQMGGADTGRRLQHLEDLSQHLDALAEEEQLSQLEDSDHIRGNLTETAELLRHHFAAARLMGGE